MPFIIYFTQILKLRIQNKSLINEKNKKSKKIANDYFFIRDLY